MLHKQGGVGTLRGAQMFSAMQHEIEILSYRVRLGVVVTSPTSWLALPFTLQTIVMHWKLQYKGLRP